MYDASSFRDYPGGRYSGQRNHVHKFEKTYPDHVFRTCEAEDLPAMQKFLCEYADTQYDKDDVLADEEMQGTFDILPHIAELGLYCGALYAGGKMVALSVGERCGDTMIIHIEKALRGVAGGLSRRGAGICAHFLCGRRALHQPRGRLGRRRAAQIQIAVPARAAGRQIQPRRAPRHRFPLQTPLRTDGAPHAARHPDEDAPAFAVLARDEELNRWWGYNWRERTSAEHPEDKWFLEDIRFDFRHKNEIPLGIYFGETLVGEVVLHSFGYRAEAEIGMRVLPAWQRRGIAREALLGMMEYGFLKLGLERIEAKCFKENEVSPRALRAAGMRPCGEDDTYFHFYKTAAM